MNPKVSGMSIGRKVLLVDGTVSRRHWRRAEGHDRKGEWGKRERRERPGSESIRTRASRKRVGRKMRMEVEIGEREG